MYTRAARYLPLFGVCASEQRRSLRHLMPLTVARSKTAMKKVRRWSELKYVNAVIAAVLRASLCRRSVGARCRFLPVHELLLHL